MFLADWITNLRPDSAQIPLASTVQNQTKKCTIQSSIGFVDFPPNLNNVPQTWRLVNLIMIRVINCKFDPLQLLLVFIIGKARHHSVFGHNFARQCVRPQFRWFNFPLSSISLKLNGNNIQYIFTNTMAPIAWAGKKVTHLQSHILPTVIHWFICNVLSNHLQSFTFLKALISERLHLWLWFMLSAWNISFSKFVHPRS